MIRIGSMDTMALGVAQFAHQQSIEVTVIYPLWVKPISSNVTAMCAKYSTVVVMEEGNKLAGSDCTIDVCLREARSECNVR